MAVQADSNGNRLQFAAIFQVMVQLKFAVKSPLIPLFPRGNSLGGVQNPSLENLEKRGRGDFWWDGVANFWVRTLAGAEKCRSSFDKAQDERNLD